VPDMERGDLIFTLKQRLHDRFTRVGNNLFIEVDLTLEESLLGFKKVVSHLDGKEVLLKSSDDEII
jgi:DnaJ-class molecular chaperone